MPLLICLGWKRRDVPFCLEVGQAYFLHFIKLTYNAEHSKSGNAVSKETRKRRRKRRSFSSSCVHSEKPSAAPSALSASLGFSIQSTAYRASRTRGCSEVDSHTLQEVQRASYGMLCRSTSGARSSARTLSLRRNRTMQCSTNVTIESTT